MDSEHRHELKSNELADLLTHLPQFFKKNASTIIGLSLIIIGLITWPIFTRMSREKTITDESRVSESIRMLSGDIGAALQAYQSNPEGLDAALNTIQANADALMDMTSETDNPNLAALAYIKAAQAIRTELHLRKDIVDAATIDTQTQKAQDTYEKAAEKAVIPTMKAMAQFGIGLCTEERGQTQQAADLYKAIVDDESFAATVFPTLAQERLDNLTDNSQAVTFAPAPVVEPKPQAAPTPEMMPQVSQPAPAADTATKPVEVDNADNNAGEK